MYYHYKYLFSSVIYLVSIFFICWLYYYVFSSIIFI